eukprot:gene1449-1594_t
MPVYMYTKIKEVPAGYFILCLTRAEELQCSASSLVRTEKIEELWLNEAIKEKFSSMAKRLKEDIRQKGSARHIIDWRSDARYEAVSN